jgi:hypothetical protein
VKPIALVAGALAVKVGKGGHAWSRVSFVAGLRRLGFEVLFVEQLPRPDPGMREYFERVSRDFNLGAHLVCEKPSYELIARAEAASLLLNIGGHLTIPEVKRPAPVRIYLDDDPAYTQLWSEAGLLAERLGGHTHYFTFGTSIGCASCTLPDGGIEWHTLLPPVVLDDWPVTNGVCEGFTTVASWRGGYGRLEAAGHVYGQKAHQFRHFVETAERSGGRFEIALEIDDSDSADAELMRSHGWRLVDPRQVAASPQEFRRYVQKSGAEFSVAQGIYVETRCGWFSDRTTRYLATGKPALVQDTGFSRHLPTGEGLVAFTTIDEAVEGARDIARRYDQHAAAAREIAERHFSSDVVLGKMLEAAGL